MAETDFGDSIKEIVEDIAAGIHDKVQDQTATADSESAADQTPVRRKARIAPRVVRVAARFGSVGGSLDRRSGHTDRWIEDSPRRSGWDSPAGDLALPASTTWSNGTIVEAVARKGKRNNRAVSEGVVDRHNEKDDRAAERKLVVAVDTTRPSHGKVMAVSLGSTCVVRVTGLVAVQHVISSPGLWKLTSCLQSPSQLMYVQS